MFGKPYHKMPNSTWMVPGGNREKKLELMRTQSYPMKSAIQKNLGGPLSSAFFSSLTPTQQGHIGYTPRLAGPGRSLWVSPSDILDGCVVLTPPYTSHLRQALTHQGILEMGAEIEAKVARKHEMDVAHALEEKEREMLGQMEQKIKEAVEGDRLTHQLITDQILAKANDDLMTTYQGILECAMSEAAEEGSRHLHEAVAQTRREMEEQLCLAVASHTDYLARQYEFQGAWTRSQLYDKYEEQLKNHQKSCSTAMEKTLKEFNIELKKTITRLEAEHINEILLKVNDLKKIHSTEKKDMDYAFNEWFMSYFQNEIMKRDFDILGLEHVIRTLKSKCSRRENQIEEIFRHFQKFINFALKEKPGQAEFLLNVRKELGERIIAKADEESEEEYIARLILEYIVKDIDDHGQAKDGLKGELDEQSWENNTLKACRKKIAQEKLNNRLLQLVGEESEKSSTENSFQKSRKSSLATMIGKNPSLIPAFLQVLPNNDPQSD